MSPQLSRRSPRLSPSASAGRFTFLNLAFLIVLFVLPGTALHRLGVDGRLVAGYAVAISVISYCFYAADKRRAQQGQWRIPENILHLTELLGGWPGAFIGQRRLRHKTSKLSYQFVFWFIVFAYQFAAFDSLQNWRNTKTLLDYVESKLR